MQEVDGGDLGAEDFRRTQGELADLLARLENEPITRTRGGRHDPVPPREDPSAETFGPESDLPFGDVGPQHSWWLAPASVEEPLEEKRGRVTQDAVVELRFRSGLGEKFETPERSRAFADEFSVLLADDPVIETAGRAAAFENGRAVESDELASFFGRRREQGLRHRHTTAQKPLRSHELVPAKLVALGPVHDFRAREEVAQELGGAGAFAGRELER